jgi:uncharacterized protein (TIGR03437 family)
MLDPMMKCSAPSRQRNRVAAVRLFSLATLFLPVLGQAQVAVPVYTVTTLVGTGTAGKTGDDAAATAATLNLPSSVAINSAGNLYISDQGNNVIRAVKAGNISEFAGTGTTSYSGDGAAATSATLNIPDTVVLDSKGNVYISDVNNNVIRMVNTSGNISTVAGQQSMGAGFSGDGGTAVNGQLSRPGGIALASNGDLYISDTSNRRIRKVSGTTITTIAGSGAPGYSGNGGPAVAAHFGLPRQIAIDAAGSLYVADETSNQIRKIVGGVITLVAGSPTGVAGYSGDGGTATSALLNHPRGVAIDTAGNIFICDTFNQVIRMVTADGIIRTVAGIWNKPGYTGDGGPALSAQFNAPTALNIDSSGKIYVADYTNNVIRLLTPSAGTGGPGTAPAIRASNGVVSASDFGALPTVAPGSWIEIYGSNLAAVTRSWATSDFSGINAPTSLDRTSVMIGGQAAFIDYVSPTQINAQVPGTIGLNSQPVTVSTAAGTSAAFNVNVALQQPAIYAPVAFRIVGKQYVGALFTDFSTYVFPTGSFSGINSRPAKPGETIVLYGIGFGAVPGNPPGQIAQVANGLTLPIAPKFYFNGVQAQVTYAGLVANAVGLYQFNIVVPAIAANAAAPITFTVNINGTDVAGTQTLFTAVGN